MLQHTLLICVFFFTGHSVVSNHTKDGVNNIFEEIGFSPACVSKTLAQCENSRFNCESSAIASQKLDKVLNSIQFSAETIQRPRNCFDLFENGDKESGVRKVFPFISCCERRWKRVYCDQKTDGGGWTMFQHRENLPQREDFYRKWIEYQLGFGDLEGEFWLGLDAIHALVSEELMELSVDLEDYDGDKRWAKYDFFHVSGPDDNFRLSVGNYSGNAGDSLSYHSGHPFSTHDKDNDNDTTNCAQVYKGAWWYNECHRSNLNGHPHVGHHSSHADGINWKAFRGYNISMKITTMRIRPKLCSN